MPEPLKNRYNHRFIHKLINALEDEYAPFEKKKFYAAIFNHDWDTKELKQRMRHITLTLHQFLPHDYDSTIQILQAAAVKFSGFEPMFYPDYVEVYGLESYTTSIAALEHFTKYSSSEFAVRPFIIKYPHKMMFQMEKWAQNDNHHVRRLATEGCRPRLPWAISLPQFKLNPQPVIKILDSLKNDSSEYVRRSVANNLNDISKDNPQIVIELAKKWRDTNKNTNWIIKHACRSLLKQGNSDVMAIFDLAPPTGIQLTSFKHQKEVKLGYEMKFTFNLHTNAISLGKIRIEYAIDFMKNNGNQTRKIFKITEVKTKTNTKLISKKHSFKPISTRKYYLGKHGLAIIINGCEIAKTSFQLI